ncbi:MAG: PspA/IM30 family protein [Erythrobacter sp.]|uniref:PspA/IM30 family protein n=1 Tax=Erythrobacter sp. TaxID=1042 RepID=UPI002629E825|nr:PspA/IM30 family protein [Erythrobacter sp.]MDJ0979031.1 PspA/IM30 family protein [Erythrobacter sp.]
MLRVAIQVKELISSNVTSVIETASDPVKMLGNLQREIEESIIALQGERTRADRRKSRLDEQKTQQEMREADWGEKAKIAMDHGREDLARQALMAREDCRAALAKLDADSAAAEADLKEIDEAISELEAKREETREQILRQSAADAHHASTETVGRAPSKADRHRNRISELEKRTEFATDGSIEKRAQASVEQEIETMRRESKIDDELAAMKGAGSKKAPRKRSAAKK